jgi:hypothetical protein
MREPADARRAAIASELQRIREAAHGTPRERSAAEVLPEPRPTASPSVLPLRERPPLTRPSPRPDNAAVNELCSLPHTPPAGVRGLLLRLLRRLLAPILDVQTQFNCRQAQLDNELLQYVEARFASTHAHYDEVLGHYGRHLGEADERHVLLEKELVAHVHDLVRRIDLVLAESERSRLSLESALRDLRVRLQEIETRLRPPAGP